MKMRTLYFSGKKKLVALAQHLEKNSDNYKADKIPPDYSLDKERLLIMAVSTSNPIPDILRRFSAGMTPDKAKNVALITDATEENAKALIDVLKAGGSNVIENVLYVKTGFLPFGSASEEEKKQADAWYEKIITELK